MTVSRIVRICQVVLINIVDIQDILQKMLLTVKTQYLQPSIQLRERLLVPFSIFDDDK
jgi:hypothetical protein